MARFFIDRPVFAWVLAIIMMLAGAISITRLPVERYPTIAPPTVSVSAFYPGATARAVEESRLPGRAATTTALLVLP